MIRSTSIIRCTDKQLTATYFARVVGCSRKTIYNYLFHYENTHCDEYAKLTMYVLDIMLNDGRNIDPSI